MNASTIELLKLWYIFSLTIGLWTSLNLGFMKNANRPVNSTLLVLVCLLSVPPLNGYVQLVSSTPINWLLTLSQNLTWFYGPLLLVIIKQSLLINTGIRYVIYHVAPFIIVNIACQIDGDFTMKFAYFYLLLFLQTGLYCLYSAYLIKSKKQKVKKLIKNHRDTTFFWLLFLVLGMVCLIILDIVVINLATRGYLSNFHWVALIACCVGLYTNTISLLTIYQPEIFYKNSQSEKAEESTAKIRHIELTPDAAKELEMSLDKLVKMHKPHLDESISLEKLASLLGVTRNQLSELFNVHKSTSFYEFLNELRYQESIKLLTGANNSNSIADIAYQAGFNNRNSFYKVFKEKSGTNPSEFRKQIREV